ncbi:MAG: permease [Halanaerobiales bacterium]|nr:permease [Halanaerobiales bacterium]
MVAIIINAITISLLGFTIFKNKEKAKKALVMALVKAVNVLPMLLVIIVLIGLIFGFIPPEMIRNYLGSNDSILQIVLASIFGAITLIPSIVALPLAGSLIEAGASYTPVAAFITTLTMVGFITLPIELKELGKKITILRNVFAFIFAIIISLIIGVLM